MVTGFRDEDYYFIALSQVKDIGPISAKNLLSHFKHPSEIFKASIDELASCNEIGIKRAQLIKSFNEWDKIDGYLKKIDGLKVSVIKYTDEGYPEGLKNLDDSPILLYCKGTYKKEDDVSLAIVGSRNMTEYGRTNAHRLAFALASVGITIVSGFARGIDTIAHQGALKAKGRTIAVVGSGLDIVYPSENIRLYENIVESGCILSEFPFGTPPDKHNFPRRNRLISGISLGVVVVEAAVNSGSLITAQYALEQNKEVFAVPGSVNSVLSQGTNNLIKKGARLVQHADDIIEELLPQLKNLVEKEKPLTAALEINDKEKAILSSLDDEPVHIDDIVRKARISVDELLVILLNLEIKGLIKQREGKRFCKA
ncbi:MAG: DNA-processing protein DprA [Thermodesulfovibrionales bacterium]|nr:DNA-processing protein DprA [Thermodesulfovibrionales bacterium]